MLTETEFNALGEKLKTVTHNRCGKKVLRAYLAYDYAFYCAAVAKNEGKEPSDVIKADYFNGSAFSYYPNGLFYHDTETLNDLVL